MGFARAAHVRMEEAVTNNQWQPIETAPKDGTWIDLWAVPLNGAPAGRFPDMHYSFGCFRHPPIHSFPAYGEELDANATHWMPRPERPGMSEINSDGLLAALNAMTDEQRLEVFFNYCQHCGSKDRGCQCMNDE